MVDTRDLKSAVSKSSRADEKAHIQGIFNLENPSKMAVPSILPSQISNFIFLPVWWNR